MSGLCSSRVLMLGILKSALSSSRNLFSFSLAKATAVEDMAGILSTCRLRKCPIDERRSITIEQGNGENRGEVRRDIDLGTSLANPASCLGFGLLLNRHL